MSDIKLTEGHRKNLSMISSAEKRSYTEEFIFDDDVSSDAIKSAIESICDVKVKKVHSTDEWLIHDVVDNVRGVTIGYSLKINGKECLFTRKFLPRVLNTKDKNDVEFVLKGLFGSTFKIVSWQERS